MAFAALCTRRLRIDKPGVAVADACVTDEIRGLEISGIRPSLWNAGNAVFLLRHLKPCRARNHNMGLAQKPDTAKDLKTRRVGRHLLPLASLQSQNDARLVLQPGL